MAGVEILRIVSSFMGMNEQEVANLDAKARGLFISAFLRRRLVDTLEGRDTFTREAFAQFLFDGFYRTADPTNERSKRPPGADAIIHSYPNAVTLSVTRTCHVKCTYCFRGDLIEPAQTFAADPVAAGLSWIGSHPEIRTVVVTGGDPFTVPPAKLHRIVADLVALPSVEEIRLDTRVLTVRPSAINGNSEARRMLAAGNGKLWFYSQINSAAEFHPDVDRAVETVRTSGVPVINQAVILKGVNDHPDLMQDLVLHCIKRGIRTDYLYILDGIDDSTFRVDDDGLVAIFRRLWSNELSGLARPRAVYVDPLTNTKSQLLLSPMGHDEEVVFRNFLEKRQNKYRHAIQQSLQ